MRKLLKSPWTFAVIVTVVFFVINLILTLNHEPYCDEAGTWLFSKGLSVSEMFSMLKADGHPPLFYLILMPFSKLGFPYITVNLISLAITTLAVLLLVRYAPFPKWLRILIVLSPAFTYFIPAFGRDYCLAALGIVLVCITYKNRMTRPIIYAASIALLFQSHVVAAAPAGLLGLLFLYEHIKAKQINRPFFIGLGILGLSFALMALPLLGSLGTHGYLEGSSVRGQSSVVAVFQSMFGDNVIIAVLLAVFGFYFLLYTLQYPKQLIVFVGSVAAYLFVCEFIYALYKPQQTALILQLVMLVYWTAHYEVGLTKFTKKIKKLFSKFELTKIFMLLVSYPAEKGQKGANRLAAFMCVPFVFAMPPLVNSAHREMIYDFSIAKAAGRYINENTPAGSVLITGNEHIASLAITPYLSDGRIMWDAVLGQEMRYMKFDHESFEVMPYAELEQMIFEKFGGQEYIYYLVTAWDVDENGLPYYQEETKGAAVEFLDRLELVHEYYDPNASSEWVIGESYYALYKIPADFSKPE